MSSCARSDGIAGSSLSAKRHIPIPFPRRPVVGRERLAPNRSVRIRFVPLKHGDDRFPFKNVFCVKSSDVAVEGTDLGDIKYDHIAIRPINTPKPGLRIEQAKCRALKRDPIKFSDELVGISEAVQDFMAGACRIKLEPFRAIIEPRLEFFVADFPLADEKIEIVIRGSFRRNNIQIASWGE